MQTAVSLRNQYNLDVRAAHFRACMRLCHRNTCSLILDRSFKTSSVYHVCMDLQPDGAELWYQAGPDP